MRGPVIIGGGPAGATAAILLARAGRDVTLIERNASPTDKVCGDFLSAEAIEAIAALGVDVPALAPSRITTVRLVHANRAAAARLPFAALGLTRRALDEALLRQAKLSGATILRGHSVRGITRNNGSLWIDCGPPGPVAAETVFLATGKHDLRGAARTGRGTGLVGMKMYYALGPRQRTALRGHVELILFAGGYVGLQLVEFDQAVLCVLVAGARLRAADGQWIKLLDSLMTECPHLADRLADARPLLERPLAIAGLPYGYKHTAARAELARAVPPRRPGECDRLPHRRRRGARAGQCNAGLPHLAWPGQRSGRLSPRLGAARCSADAPVLAHPSRLPCPGCTALVVAVVPVLAPGHAARCLPDAPARRHIPPSV